MTYPATPEAARLFDFMQAYAAENGGASPTHDEMKDALGLRSKSGVNRMLVQLEERGLIERKPYRARCIRIVLGQPVTLPPDLYLEAHAAAGRAGIPVSKLVAAATRAWLESE